MKGGADFFFPSFILKFLHSTLHLNFILPVCSLHRSNMIYSVFKKNSFIKSLIPLIILQSVQFVCENSLGKAFNRTNLIIIIVTFELNTVSEEMSDICKS